MLKRDITFENFDGEMVTETLYFNLTKTEIIELEASVDGGLQASIQRIIESKDGKALIEEFKRIILVSFGEKSEDGKRFIKTDQMREEFSQTAAFDALFMELATNDSLAADFMTGVLPRDMARAIARADEKEGNS